ncbi:unnamed protein product [Dibothriocephalus latus]|uniref:Coiled-coil domain-containing protein 153 n=1 Tax=Dibothriocephalus latus TaxID=60516 RepID=A0A3P6U2D6_DIBLA|nr:unnamed protein product [Dibothriocephalus latus]
MPPKKQKEKPEKRPEELVRELTHTLGMMQAKLDTVSLRELVNTSVRKKMTDENIQASRRVAEMRENLEMNKVESKLATSCVNTQYKLLQRLFILRVRESREIITRLKKEHSEVKALLEFQIASKDQELAEKNATIDKLEKHLNSLHFQLERVVLEMVDKMEKGLEADRSTWEDDADYFYTHSKNIMKKLGYGREFL